MTSRAQRSAGAAGRQDQYQRFDSRMTRAQLKAETLAIARQRIGRAQSADPRTRRPAATRSPAGGASGAALRRRAANRLDRALSMK